MSEQERPPGLEPEPETTTDERARLNAEMRAKLKAAEAAMTAPASPAVPLPRAVAQQISAFLDGIAGDGYGGMSVYDVAAEAMRHALAAPAPDNVLLLLCPECKGERYVTKKFLYDGSRNYEVGYQTSQCKLCSGTGNIADRRAAAPASPAPGFAAGIEAALRACDVGTSGPINPDTVGRTKEIYDAIAALISQPTIKRWEVVNDGPGRWVLVDSESDDPCPVYESEAAAHDAARTLTPPGAPAGAPSPDAGGELLRLAHALLPVLREECARSTSVTTRHQAVTCIEGLLEALARRGEGVWQPIETFDGRTQAVLVWVPNNKCVYAADNRGGVWSVFGSHGVNIDRHAGEPSHWQPLPPPPAASDRGAG